MTSSPAGFLALSTREGQSAPPGLDAAAEALGGPVARRVTVGGLTLVLVGVEAANLGGVQRTAVLARGPRRHEDDLTPAGAAELLADTGRRHQALPPFAVVGWNERSGEIVAAVDRLGFRHLYARTADGWSALSTSARALAALDPSGVDRVAMAAQSMLGWQLGNRSPFADVSVAPAGSAVSLDAGQLAATGAAGSEDGPWLGLDETVSAAATLLRGYLGAFLDDHPDAVLQLTGGQDSRILLGAIPPARRRGLRVMTLAVQGSADLEIARDLTRRYGMDHDVIDLDGLDELDPDAAHALATDAARKLECSADPLAFASVAFAEAKLEPRPRLSGLGGEVTRGFYYLGPARSVPVTARRVRRLADWRLFPNEAVPADVLDPAFADWARERTLRELTTILIGYGPDWLTATDRFYLHQRMHRWAGVLASATCLDRPVVNPMLDDRFLELAARLRPRDKQGSRFLARLSVRLDEQLSALPLDGRPAPVVYAQPSLRNTAALAAMTGGKITGKVRQRVRRVGRPPVGGEVLAAKVGEHYRDHPAALEAVARLRVVRPDWLAQVAEGRIALGPAAAAMLVNLEVATAPVRQSLPR